MDARDKQGTNEGQTCAKNATKQHQKGSKCAKIAPLDIVSHKPRITNRTNTLENKKAPSLGLLLWSVADSNCRPLPCEGSALNQLS